MTIQFVLPKNKRVAYQFCEYIIKWLRKEIDSKSRRLAIQNRLEILSKSSLVNWIGPPQKLSYNQFMKVLKESICFTEVRQKYIIYIDPNIYYPGTTTRVNKIARFVDQGDLNIRGTYFITKVFLHYQKNIYDYFNAFRTLRFR